MGEREGVGRPLDEDEASGAIVHETVCCNRALTSAILGIYGSIAKPTKCHLLLLLR